MKTNDKITNLTRNARQRFGRWLMLLLLRGDDPDGESFALVRTPASRGNAPPIRRRWLWYGSRHGLWRLVGKPVPMRSTRFRRT
ncbi:MAG: hypothetical protein NTW16_05660 [Bacteroidetes bacterium]|nr:hypothetical protein [Bacteroidota bacterium]